MAKWESLADPVILAQQMWNHGPKMRAEFARRKLAWGKITAQELTDMLVYLQNLPETRNLAQNLSFPPSDSGEKLYVSKGCRECHAYGSARVRGAAQEPDTHGDRCRHVESPAQHEESAADIRGEEMRQLISYIWAKQYFRGTGNASRGRYVFTAKNCANCHNDAASGAPKLGKGKDAYNDITMVAALWDHGPRMLEMMTARGLPWPRFSAQEMSDVIAYLNSL